VSNIKITMLGTKGAGKTCFLLGMYAKMRQGVRGFTFSTQDPDVDLDLSDRWSRLVNEHGDQRWPKPNDNEVQTYEFNFSYGFRKLLGFDWIDYRGGALRGRTAEADVDMLFKQVRSSASLFLCVSGEDLAKSRSIQQICDRIHTAEMNKFLSALEEKAAKPSVAVVITKYDHCRERDKEEIVELVQELFHPLFVDGAGWLVTICPVSLGNDLAADPGAGEIDPKNVHLPVAFAIYSEFKQRMAEVDDQLQWAQDRQYEMGRTFLGRLFNRSDLQRNSEQRSFLEKNREEIENNINLLSEELMRGATLFYDGGKVELDV
jgi:Double-GTPase 2